MDVKQQVIRPAFALSERREAAHLPVSACYQCKECSGGCPLTFAMDLFPDQVIRLALLGQEEKVLTCSTIWVCSACETCTTRCPNGIKNPERKDRAEKKGRRRGGGGRRAGPAGPP